jgi:DNA-3-methyladenine glycosylase
VTAAAPRAWFARPARDLAIALLGSRLVVGDVQIRLTEVEAYQGASDPGSHAYRGRTARNATMFGEGGHLYIYRHMGLHSCANVVASHEGHANGCLLRAGEVVAGLDVARARRAAAGVTRRDTDLAQGPGRLTVAAGLTYALDGLDLCATDGDGNDASGVRARILPRDGVAPPVVSGPRIGLRAEASDPELYPLRFWIPGDPTVSGPPALNRGGRPVRRAA